MEQEGGRRPTNLLPSATAEAGPALRPGWSVTSRGTCGGNQPCLPPPPFPPPKNLPQSPEPSSRPRPRSAHGSEEGQSAARTPGAALPEDALPAVQNLLATSLREEHERIMQHEICPKIASCCSLVEAAVQRLERQMQEPSLVEAAVQRLQHPTQELPPVEALGALTLPDGKLTRFLETWERRFVEMISGELKEQVEPLRDMLKSARPLGEDPRCEQPGDAAEQQHFRWESGATAEQLRDSRKVLEARKTSRNSIVVSSDHPICNLESVNSRSVLDPPKSKRLSQNISAVHQASGHCHWSLKSTNSSNTVSRMNTNTAWWFRRHLFEIFSMVLIFCNCIYLGLEVHISISHQKQGKDTPGWLWYGDLLFSCIFTTELAIRVVVLRRSFFTGPDWRWNMIDAVMILVPMTDFFVSLFNPSFSRCLHAFRAIRACRIIRTALLVRELRLMVASILSSFVALVWAFFLLLSVLYLCAISIMLSMEAHVRSRGTEILTDTIVELWGSVPTSMLTLFMAISGGADWRDLLEPLRGISFVYTFIFIGFVLFVVVGVMNVLTAVFVDSASQIAHINTATLETMNAMLRGVSSDGGQTITYLALRSLLEDANIISHLRIMGLDVDEVLGLFRLLDVDEAKEVAVGDLVMGMLRLKGSANKSADVATAMYENKRIIERLSAITLSAEQHFSELAGMLQTLRPG